MSKQSSVRFGDLPKRDDREAPETPEPRSPFGSIAEILARGSSQGTSQPGASGSTTAPSPPQSSNPSSIKTENGTTESDTTQPE